ncbi:MAG: SDR family NAD(P)-dependent oxidoreductase [Pseudomonadales bacterium]|nr:SDR family NAD(P)-dependent oxidoreductase [Halioglobus sp.]MCP5129624.1 SDR family NAD(P)-dependent oxidoreductase [Pseudomonadales bacterium]
MRVMITGGTGFVGYHTAQALMAAGHRVSLLVRSVDKMLQLYGDDCDLDYTRGDITDVDKVNAALAECDAVIHAAAMVSTKASDAEKVFNTNIDGARTVIGGALKIKSVKSIIHVSSVTALYDPSASILDENSPPGVARNAYGRSKVACEKYVRNLKPRGKRVYITYPATVIGPDDPGMTESHVGMQGYLTAFVPLMPSGNQYVDVRDVADAHLRLLEQRPAGGYFTLGGHFLPWAELGRVLEKVTGRHLLKLPLSGGLMRLTGRVFDRLHPYISVPLPISEEAMEYATNWVPLDNHKAEKTLGLSFRPAEESMADTVRWLCQAGHISSKQAGVLAG